MRPLKTVTYKEIRGQLQNFFFNLGILLIAGACLNFQDLLCMCVAYDDVSVAEPDDTV